MIKEPSEVEVEVYSEEQYENMLDEIYGDIDIAGLTFSSSYALKELDPIAYRCGYLDYQEYETRYICPECGEEYNDSEDARWCCQDYPTCLICGEYYETEEEAEECCAEMEAE